MVPPSTHTSEHAGHPLSDVGLDEAVDGSSAVDEESSPHEDISSRPAAIPTAARTRVLGRMATSM
ncbi:hypothetical protein GCM10022242_29640 [Nocardioides panacisoli]|uniref:Uncharacterized protein n=1 Tax=Nocardioides panacisoli TaxID=627624 RepID=A0ABP7IT01_9ACTN